MEGGASMLFTVQQLIEGRPTPQTVKPDDSVQHALDLMLAYDYSLLPVVADDDKPLGMITSGSILSALNGFRCTLDTLHVSDATFRFRRTFRAEDNLFDLLDDLRDAYAVLIVDKEDKLIGIVTNYDTSEYFRRHSQDLMWVEDVEEMLRDYIRAGYLTEAGEPDPEALRAAIKEYSVGKDELRKKFRVALKHFLNKQGSEDKNFDSTAADEAFTRAFVKDIPESLEQLTFADYIELLLNQKQWPKYTELFAPQSSDALRTLLKEVNAIRNTLAHFRGDLSPAQQDKLKFCSAWLRARPASRLLPGASRVVTGVEETTPPTANAGEPKLDELAKIRNEVADTDQSRYAPLGRFLYQQPSGVDKLPLSFREIEEIIRTDLPPSARKYRAFWTNNPTSHPQSREWLDVDWQVASVSMDDEQVVFSRMKAREQGFKTFFDDLEGKLKKVMPSPFTLSDEDLRR